MSVNTFSTSGFTIYGSGLYYIYGSPKVINSGSKNMSMDLIYPYSIFLIGGVFQKQIRVRSVADNLTVTKDVGGLQLGLGGNYNWSDRTYITSQIQMLSSGQGSDEEFTSTELYIGIGIRL